MNPDLHSNYSYLEMAENVYIGHKVWTIREFVFLLDFNPLPLYIVTLLNDIRVDSLVTLYVTFILKITVNDFVVPGDVCFTNVSSFFRVVRMYLIFIPQVLHLA